MHQFRIRYSLIGIGTYEEIVSARSNWEAEKIIKNRHAPNTVFVVSMAMLD